VDDFEDSLLAAEFSELVPNSYGVTVRGEKKHSKCGRITVLTPTNAQLTHTVKRTGCALTYAELLTYKASQGQALRTGVTIACARLEPQGARGLREEEEEWWLHLHVMLSRATCMEKLFLYMRSVWFSQYVAITSA